MKNEFDGEKARNLVDRLCQYVSAIAGRKIYAEMSFEDDDYEGHIVDSGKCKEDSNGDFELSDVGEDIGMIFWGGHYSVLEHHDAENLAWISLLYDCIGQCDDLEIRNMHSLTNALRDGFGPEIALDFENIESLKKFLDENETV